MARVLMAVRPSKGGAFWHAVRLAQALQDAGHEAAVCGPHAAHAGQIDVPLIELEIPREVSPAGQARALRGFARVVRDFQPDLIHAHGSQAGGLSRLSRPAHPRVPVVFSPHNFAFVNWFASERERRVYLGMERLLSPLTTRFIAVCGAELRQLSQVGGRRRGRLVYNGIVPFDPGPPDTALERLREAGPLLLCVTELHPRKGIPTLLEAMPPVLEASPSATLAIAGDGPSRAELEEQIQAMGLAERVRLLGNVADVGALLAAADLFVAPSYSESFPYANLEAMSARLPIVATNVGGVGEAVIDRETGLLVEPRDAPALAAAMTELLTDRELARALGERAREVLEERFTFARMIEETFAVYAEVGAA